MIPNNALKLLFICVTAFFLCTCSTYEGLTKQLQNGVFFSPPGTIQIDSNFFADIHEISNLGYREYEYWIRTVYGVGSAKYMACKTDTMSWRALCPDYNACYYEYLVYAYFSYPAHDSHPVIGVSFEQANAYCKWRSDMVLQALLCKLGLIEFTTHGDSADYFTAERYYTGNYRGYKPNLTIPYPEYRLPTPAEWERLALGKSSKNDSRFGYDFASKLVREKGNNLFNTSELKTSFETYGSNNKNETDSVALPRSRHNTLCNDYGLFNTIGNISEMTSEFGIAKGGSFTHKLRQCAIDSVQTYTEPACWLGFRAVCSWRFYQESTIKL